jgi:hypothetical protein
MIPTPIYRGGDESMERPSEEAPWTEYDRLLGR